LDRKSLPFRPAQRLRQPKQFQVVYRQGRRFGNEWLTAAVCASSPEIPRGAGSGPIGGPRLGLSIAARTVGNSVQRNRLRRLIRESFRQHQRELPAVDIVIGARARARGAATPEVLLALGSLWKQIIATCAK